MAEEQAADVISLTLPHMDEMRTVIRLTTVAVASRTGLTIDQADDLNTALDELSRLFHESTINNESDFHIEYFIYSDRLEVITIGPGHSLTNNNAEISRYSRFILENVCDSYENHPFKKDDQLIKLIKYIHR